MVASGAIASPRGVDVGLSGLGLCEAAGLLAEGRASAQELTQACLARIGECDGDIGAWAHLDVDHALMQARAIDAHRAAGRPLGPLHGVPVGVKDVIDASGLPCELGTELESGRRPREDATVVALLRAAGAVVLGKTVTTELAVYHPGKTRNPHDLSRTPGGSSSGSAAAVAAGMVPGALGTQTNGSVIRPASFCGIYGFKPSHELVSRRGVLADAPSFDTVGTMARSIDDIALLTDVIARYDPADPWMRPAGSPRLHEAARSEPPVRPLLAFVRSPAWERAGEDTRAGLAELCDVLGDRVEEVELLPAFERVIELHHTVMAAEIARNLGRYHDNGGDRLSGRLRGIIEEGRGVSAVDYILARDWIDVLNASLDEVFMRYDAILTPAATGEAPGPETTGDASFCTPWSFCRVPAISVPLLVGSSGLPIGVQLVGKRGWDGRLLRTARWLVRELESEGA